MVKNWRNHAFKFYLVRAIEISQGFSLFTILSRATLKALVGRMFDAPGINTQNTLESKFKSCS